jgi:cytochrome c-type biogenesis protein CcmH
MRSRAAVLAAALTVAWLSTPALAVQPDEVLANPALEGRARAISAGLRCLVCQNQSIDDSDAPLARDLRILVRERLKAGDTDAAVTDFIVQRYGEFVLLKPVFKAHTLLLWFAPFLILALGAAGLVFARRTRPEPVAAPLSGEEKDALDEILNERGPPARQ